METKAMKTKTMTTSKTETENTTPMIYVACLASLAIPAQPINGKWIDATQSLETIRAKVDEVLKDSPLPNAEEYTIHKYDNFESYTIGEQTDLTKVHEVACLIVDHPFIGTAVMEEFDCDFCEARMRIDQDFLGSYESLADYVQESIADMYGKDVILLYEGYMNSDDYDEMGGVWDLNGDIDVFYSDTAVYVFIG